MFERLVLRLLIGLSVPQSVFAEEQVAEWDQIVRPPSADAPGRALETGEAETIRSYWETNQQALAADQAPVEQQAEPAQPAHAGDQWLDQLIDEELNAPARPTRQPTPFASQTKKPGADIEAERARAAVEKAAELERLSEERAAKARLLAERTLQKRLAEEQAKQQRLSEERAAKARLLAERAEKQRLAEERAEQIRLAKEQADLARRAAKLAAERQKMEERRKLEEIARRKREEMEAGAAAAAHLMEIQAEEERRELEALHKKANLNVDEEGQVVDPELEQAEP